MAKDIFHDAVKNALQKDQLYLAVPLETYETFFQTSFAQVAVKRHQLKLIVYNSILEEIVTWIN